MSLSGKVAIVTGATGVLGRVVTKMLLSEDARVVSTFRSDEKRSELGDFGVKAVPCLLLFRPT
jgi:NAD(P)-dependent dehydrogenase (short-subunit alcohol dehydrogenase family)